MADKAEKELPEASDCRWLRGLDASGNPIRILKEDLVNMMPSLSRAFSYKEVAFKTGDTKNIGQVGGLMVISFPWSDNNFSVYIVSSKGRSIILLHGVGYSFLDFSFSDSGDLLVYSRYTIPEAITTLHVSYQMIMVR